MSLRIPCDRDEAQAALEAAHALAEDFVQLNLLGIVLAYWHSESEGWEWRPEDEG